MISWFSSLSLLLIGRFFINWFFVRFSSSSLPIIGFWGFSIATWPFETHKLPYRVWIFSVIFRFFSTISLIGLEGFSSGSHSSLQWCLHSANLTSEGRGNCNNMTLEAGVESFWSGSHMIIIIQNFSLVSLTSTTMPHLVGLSFGAMIPFHPTHFTTSTLPLNVYVVRRYFWLWELSIFCPRVKEWGLSFLEHHWMVWSWAIG